jgi:hypothetical protein
VKSKATTFCTQLSMTCVQTPLLHEKEQAPVYPAAQVPVSVWPLFVMVRMQLLSVVAAQGGFTQAPAALHCWPPVQPPVDPTARSPHVTPPLQLAHGPLQAEAQQKSSPPEQKPLAQSLPLLAGLHACPLTASHAPAALHAWFAAQAPCAPSARSPHVVPPAHFAHGPVQALAQQKSSPPEQKPVSQSAPLLAGLHACPATASHTPFALHAWFAGQAPCAPSARSPHVAPPVHDAHGPKQAEAQQKSSPPEQKPLAQSLPLFAGLHIWPFEASHVPAALHASFAAHPPGVPAATSPHVVPPAHEAQGPEQATLQQKSSPPEQNPLAQSLPMFDGLHAWPLTASQVPAAVQTSFAAQPPCIPAAI